MILNHLNTITEADSKLPAWQYERPYYGGFLIAFAFLHAKGGVDEQFDLKTIEVQFLLPVWMNVATQTKRKVLMSGRSFATLQIEMYQKERLVFVGIASFRKKYYQQAPRHRVTIPKPFHQAPSVDLLSQCKEGLRKKFYELLLPAKVYYDLADHNQQKPPYFEREVFFKVEEKVEMNDTQELALWLSLTDLSFLSGSYLPYRSEGDFFAVSLTHTVHLYQKPNLNDLNRHRMAHPNITGDVAHNEGWISIDEGNPVARTFQESLFRKK